MLDAWSKAKRGDRGAASFFVAQPTKHDRKNLQRLSENSCFGRRRAKMAGFAKKSSGLSSCESDIRRLITRWIMKMSVFCAGLPDKQQAVLPAGSA
jgi:hypothetical protein